MKLITRKATLKDLPTILEFEQGIINFERPLDPTLKENDISYYDLKALIQSEFAEVLVVEKEGVLVASGYAKIEKSNTYLRHQQHAYLGFMFVAPDYRGKGLNKLIVDGLVSWGKKMGVNEFRLEVYDGNDGAIKAYEKAGFKRHLIEMRFGA